MDTWPGQGEKGTHNEDKTHSNPGSTGYRNVPVAALIVVVAPNHYAQAAKLVGKEISHSLIPVDTGGIPR